MPDLPDEKIVIKPSTELIADEYEHFKDATDTVNIAVHIFASKDKLDQENADIFARTLKENDYDVDDEKNVHSLDADNFDEIIRNICDASKDLDGLILFFSGVSTKEGMMRVSDGQNTINTPIQQVVTKFTSYNCAALKNKPKIFIFQLTSPSEIQTDGVKLDRFSYDLTYDTPAEADMLIVYKKNENRNNVDFINKLCENIKKHGKNEDIISLVTYVDSAANESRPLIISTLTRNFFFTQSDYRGHHFHINDRHKALKKHLDHIKNQLSQKTINSKAALKNNAVKSASGTTNRSANNKASSAKSGAGPPNKNSRDTKNTNIHNSSQGQLTATDGGSSVKKTTEQVSYTQTRTSILRLSSTKTDGSVSNKDTRGSRSRLTSDKSDTDKTNKPRWMP